MVNQHLSCFILIPPTYRLPRMHQTRGEAKKDSHKMTGEALGNSRFLQPSEVPERAAVDIANRATHGVRLQQA